MKNLPEMTKVNLNEERNPKQRNLELEEEILEIAKHLNTKNPAEDILIKQLHNVAKKTKELRKNYEVLQNNVIKLYHSTKNK